MTDETPRRLPPRRLVRVELPGDWAGFHATLWANASAEVRARWGRATGPDVLALWGQFVVEHDLVDFDGAPLPPAGSDEFFRRVPDDLPAILLAEVAKQYGRLSKSGAARADDLPAPPLHGGDGAGAAAGAAAGDGAGRALGAAAGAPGAGVGDAPLGAG